MIKRWFGQPLVQYVNGRPVLIGIAQGIIENANEKMNCQNAQVLFIRVSLYIDWIKSIVLNH